MDVQDWQASRLRIRNSRYLQDGNVKPWPWSIQVQILGAEGSGRHSLLDRICLDEFIPNDDPFTERDSACKQTNLRGLACNVWFETPISLTSHGDGFALSKQELFYWLTRGMRDCDALILVYDLTDPNSFRELCEFCARCELEGVGVAPGSSLPCLVVGAKADLPNQEHVHDGERLPRAYGGGDWTGGGRKNDADTRERGYVGRGNTGVAGVGRREEDGIEKKTEQEKKNIRDTTTSVTTKMHRSTSTMDNEESDLSTSMPKSTRYEQF
ncbi:hypothetical protein CDV31_012237 [Fusarium ambrosium]|uniref:Uncharacterized protein n=1 Tax=Fusarium ambrosium TaxID=131363 RepID=A0A428TB66_9HYPO|nr:hypothetical protein CDV31_012237 [Fusarium ambrosium]